jgi:hypothetical protein
MHNPMGSTAVIDTWMHVSRRPTAFVKALISPQITNNDVNMVSNKNVFGVGTGGRAA